MSEADRTYYEFFAGAGMVRAGLPNQWQCLFSNDKDPRKSASYILNWGAGAHVCGDIADVAAAKLPGRADLAWASFPRQDLSLAGDGAGLDAKRPSTFWPFWKLMLDLGSESRAPSVIILENVCCTLTSHGGKDFGTICRALGAGGYRVGALVMDAALFVPQSRPRLLIVAIRADHRLPEGIVGGLPNGTFLTRSLTTAYSRLPSELRDSWVWWGIPTPPLRNTRLSQLIEDDPQDLSWNTPQKTQELLGMMSELNRAKVTAAQGAGGKMVGTLCKRARRDARGRRRVRAEVRFDDVAGCLRTPAGGSSRQLILVVEGDRLRSRLISSREAARLMGLPDEYILPDNYHEAYRLTGDGVVVPVVRYLAEKIVEPVVALARNTRQAEPAAPGEILA